MTELRFRPRGFTLVELLVVVGSAALIGLFLFMTPVRSSCCGTPANKQKCANNLKGITIGLILYSNDYRYFPHMRSLAKENTAADVSSVMRTLVQLKYIDYPEAFICPSSDDFFRPPTAAVNDPKLWTWGGKLAPTPALAITTRGDPAIETNDELSYTYIRKPVDAAKARSNTIIAADKAIRVVDKAGQGTVGNHTDGFNIAYADGHVSFVSSSNKSAIATLAQRVHLFEGKTPLTPAAVNAWK